VLDGGPHSTGAKGRSDGNHVFGFQWAIILVV